MKDPHFKSSLPQDKEFIPRLTGNRVAFWRRYDQRPTPMVPVVEISACTRYGIVVRAAYVASCGKEWARGLTGMEALTRLAKLLTKPRRPYGIR